MYSEMYSAQEPHYFKVELSILLENRILLTVELSILP